MTGAFDIIKNSIDILDVAARYGVKVNRHNKALCFYHKEKTPSMSFKNNHFKCFGCGIGGSVIDMVSLIQGIEPLEAAKEIDATYSLHLFNKQANTADIQRRVQRLQTERDKVKAFEEWEHNACVTWTTYCRMLEHFKRQYAPVSPDEKWDERFCEALQKLDYADYIFHEVFINGNFEDKARFYESHEKEVKQIEHHIREIGFTG